VTEEQLQLLALTTADQMRKLGLWVSYDGRILPTEAAALLGRSVGTLANWRSQQDHPLPYVRGKRITYRLVDVLRFIYMCRDVSEAA
jgi:hypothetical protein